MKAIRRILAVLLVLLIGAFLALVHYLDTLVVQTVNSMGPKWMGVPVTLRGAEVLPVQGVISLRGLSIGNPKGFAGDQSIGIGEIRIDVGMRSLFSNTIVISEIRIDKPEVSYEVGLGKSNIGALLDGMSGSTNSEQPEAASAADDTNGTKVVIGLLSINDGLVRIGTKLSEAVAAPIPLPTIQLRDIGKDEEKGEANGVTPVRVIRDVLGAILGSITKIVTGSVKLVGEGVQAVGNGAVKVVGTGAEVVGDGAKAVGGAAVKAGAVVGDGAKAVGGAAVKTGEAVGGAVVKTGEAVGEGAMKVVDGVKGVFTKDKAEESK